MNFNPNSSFLYLVAVFIIIFILAQSLFFLLRAYKRGKEIGMDVKKLRNTITSSAIFTVAPAVSILLGVLTLSKFLGLPLPWIRLSVIGAITYELPAATSAASALGVSVSETIESPVVYSAIAWVMTLGILPSTILVPLLIKRIQGGLVSIKNKDSKWGELLITAMFMGMISAFMGMVFSNIRKGLAGWIPIFVMLFSAVLMAVCGILIKVLKVKWLQDYALPICMIGAMAFATIITPAIV
ncbi:MAG: DUF5058 family protein [Clostridiaceae bacterium]|jgi:hypothetical protein|nr:DUF5058 family protein [Clostridiaceae bacterium]